MTDGTGELDPRLIENLSSSKPEEREAARHAIERLGPRVVDEMLEVLRKESALARRRRALGMGSLVAFMAIMLYMAITRNTDQLATFTSLISFLGVLFAASQTQKNAARVLADKDDLRVIGPLAEALDYDDKDTVAGAQRSLISLLPRLKAADHALLNHEQRRCLDRALIKKGGAALKHAILTAYEQIGDEHSLQIVERLASGRQTSVRDLTVVRHAADALPAIRAAAARVHDAHTLLRPAFVGADMLVRPAEAAPSVPVAMLVRPVGDDAEAADRSDAAADLALSRTNGSGSS